MSAAGSHRDVPGPDGAASAPPVPAAEASDAPAWEMIDKGRYMPRRIRGSYRGRELG
jgi:hypothetical protein